MARGVRGFRHTGFQRADTGTAGMAPNRPGDDLRSRPDAVLRSLNRLCPIAKSLSVPDRTGLLSVRDELGNGRVWFQLPR
jgi:hypothetical protein